MRLAEKQKMWQQLPAGHSCGAADMSVSICLLMSLLPKTLHNHPVQLPLGHAYNTSADLQSTCSSATPTHQQQAGRPQQA